MREMHAASVQGVINVPATCAGRRAGLAKGFVCACPAAGRDEGGNGGLVGGAVQVPNDDPVTANGAGFFDYRTEEVPAGGGIGGVAVDGSGMKVGGASAWESNGADAAAVEGPVDQTTGGRKVGQRRSCPGQR